MRPHPLPADRHWDGSPRHVPRRRGLQIAPTSPSRLLRAGQTGRCRHCGNRNDWYLRHDDRPHHGQLALPETTMAVYDLSHLPLHPPTALARPALPRPRHRNSPRSHPRRLAVFDPLLHAAHIRTRLPYTPARRLGDR
ncbi:DUF6083 domain-containing protein [Streptomyces sp. NPDC058683]|uniref:DUF6083 domain-containing protein n=1 Tax=Streptomyces sp. NPDC058683 TaxID=3346597 RepID=UPI003664195C